MMFWDTHLSENLFHQITAVFSPQSSQVKSRCFELWALLIPNITVAVCERSSVTARNMIKDQILLETSLCSRKFHIVHIFYWVTIDMRLKNRHNNSWGDAYQRCKSIRRRHSVLLLIPNDMRNVYKRCHNDLRSISCLWWLWTFWSGQESLKNRHD